MTGRLVRQEELTAEERAAMYALLDAHFRNVTRPQFDHDLAEKNWAVMIERSGVLLGFSTLAVYPAMVAGEQLNVVCSGDTVISPAAWGSMAFPRTWISSVYSISESLPPGRLIWLLLTSGFRTYRFLPVFWKEFYPRAGTETPAVWKHISQELAAARFGSQYCPDHGIVRFTSPQQLRADLESIPPSRQSDPDVEFFIQKNPGYIRGDELVCITELSPENLTNAGKRVVYGASR